MRVRFARPGFVLPLMMFLGVLVVGVRLGDLFVSVTSGKSFPVVTPATAETTPPEKTAPPAAASVDAAAKPALSPPPTTQEHEDNQTAADATNGEMQLVKELSNRRDQLDARAHTLDTREALIKVAEQRVDQKIKEMETLRAQLQSMVNQASAAQQAQIDNLVKIYETMKPKEAARIFESLEMPVLLGVVQKMKPQRTAAVMAEMAPEKAKEITVALTRQDQLPQMK